MTLQPQQPSPQPEVLRPLPSAPPRYSYTSEVRRSPDRDSDDSTTCFSNDDDDEPTPKAKVSWRTPGQRSPSGSEEVSPPTPPTQRRSKRLRRLTPNSRRNMAYRTPPTPKCAFIRDDEESA